MRTQFRILTLLALCAGGVPEGWAASAAATIGSPTSGGGAVTSGSSNVLIGGVPAAHLGDTATCLFLGIPTVGTILQGSPSVRINGQPAARVGSPVGTPTPCVISGGNNSVSVGP